MGEDQVRIAYLVSIRVASSSSSIQIIHLRIGVVIARLGVLRVCSDPVKKRPKRELNLGLFYGTTTPGQSIANPCSSFRKTNKNTLCKSGNSVEQRTSRGKMDLKATKMDLKETKMGLKETKIDFN